MHGSRPWTETSGQNRLQVRETSGDDVAGLLHHVFSAVMEGVFQGSVVRGTDGSGANEAVGVAVKVDPRSGAGADPVAQVE